MMLPVRLLLRPGVLSNVSVVNLLRSGSGSLQLPSLGLSGPARQFSSLRPRRPTPLPSPGARQSQIASILPLFARFKSTTTTPATSASTSESAEVAGFEPFDSLSPLDLTSVTETQKVVAEKIGFLHELGLNFGWGPTSCMQWLLEHMHVWTGTPWWASILLTVALIRAVQFPGYLKLSDMSARMKEVQPVTAPALQRFKDAQHRRDLAAAHLAKTELNNLYARAGINSKWAVFPLLQIPVFFGFYKLLRTMSDVPVPGFLDGGVLWFQNLASADPVCALPILTSVGMSVMFYLGGETAGAQLPLMLRKFLMFGLPAVSLVVTLWWPAALTFYFFCNSSFSLIQNLLLRNEAFRALFNLYPIPVPEPPPRTSMRIEDAPTPKEAEANASTFADKVRKLVDQSGAGQTQNPFAGFADKMTQSAQKKKYISYETKRKEEEAQKRKALIEAKKRRTIKEKREL